MGDSADKERPRRFATEEEAAAYEAEKESREDDSIGFRKAKLQDIYHSYQPGTEDGTDDQAKRATATQEFAYSDDQKLGILRELNLEWGDPRGTKGLSEIATVVQLTREALAYRDQHEVPDWLHEKFRRLGPAIDQVTEVLGHETSEPIRDFLPKLLTDLRVLGRMVKNDQRKRGRPPEPATELYEWMVRKLAHIWTVHHGSWPKRHHQEDKGRDWGPFYRFLGACLKPAHIEISDHVIRKAIETP